MILIIGGAGYIGAHMVRALLDAGREVVVLDDLSTGYRALVPAVPFVEGDLGDPQVVTRLLREYPVDTAMHFAAFSLVGESVAAPLKYWQNNVGRTASLLEVLARRGVTRFVFSSTAAVYGEPEKSPITEMAPLQPTNPYGATKVAVERMLADVAAAHDFRYVSLRYFNAAGAHPDGTLGEAHHPESHLIPLVLKTLTGERDRIVIFGDDYPTPDGTCLRDYIHVQDLAQAHSLALEHLEARGACRVYNLGNSRGYSVREVIHAVEQVTGRTVPVEVGPRRPGDPAELVADSALIRRELGWRPRMPELTTIVETAWRWERQRAQRLAYAGDPGA